MGIGMRFRIASIFVILASSWTLAACSTTSERYKDLPVVSVSDLLSNGAKYYDKRVIADGCLSFHGSKKYKLWRFDLSRLATSSKAVGWDPIFVDGDKIPRKYRKHDIVKETKTGDTTYSIEVVKKSEWRVLLLGTYFNKTARLNTGGHIVTDGFFETTLSDVKFVSEIHEGCEE